MRKIGWGTMAVLALLVAVYAGGALVSPALRGDFIQNLFDTAPLAVIAHLGGGIVALVAGAAQVNSRLRTRAPVAHRWLGRAYVVGVAIGGSAGLTMAFSADGGLVAKVGFGMLAVTWLSSTGIAFRQIRARDVASHRRWMLRSYALTLAAVTLRLYMPAFAIAGVGFDAAYPLIAWLCWVPNLVVVEWLVLARPWPAATAQAG